ncbi:insulinase family protein [Acidaminobacter sp. JC074]|uniref:EF-P 5-aminopentanol modification-associated protein YfmH n=1 Tax=Acidaminobacter sp. JC074 TaxID=2530199 RepID=UPI001F0EAED2|nr:pitrilysin family protein [Acidaminobacter sp. JC074]MCH4890211.1 insulinase family protein [Acidaminobacter sp. JC074]
MIFYHPLLNESLYKETLDNGFKIYVLPKKGYMKTHAFFSTEYGSLYNKFEKDGKSYEMPLGIAHFLEHKIFEDEGENTFDKFADLGASVNAFTNHFATCYTFSTVDNVEECISELLSFVCELKLSDESVEKEKDVIVQELKMYDDQPQWRAFMNMLKGLYHEHPIQFDIGGTESSVRSVTKDQLETCYNKFYTPDRMFFFLIGDVDVDQIVSIIKKNLCRNFLSRPSAPKIVLPDEPNHVVRDFHEEDFEMPMPIFYMGIKDRVFYSDTKARLKKGLISKVLSDMIFGKSSAFFEKHYESGLINQSFSCDFSYGRTFGYTAVSAETRQPKLLKEKISDEIDYMKAHGLSRDDFERIRKKMIGRHLSSFNSTKYIANTFVNYYMKGIELFDYLEILENITFDEVEDRFLEHFDLQYSTVSIVK